MHVTYVVSGCVCVWVHLAEKEPVANCNMQLGYT